LLAIHPIVQISANLTAAYVFFLGVQRFRMVHLGHKAMFNWRRHVFLGKIAMILWLAGLFGGMAIVYLYWHGFLITGIHGKVAMFMLPLIIFGLGSGLYMNRYKKNRKKLDVLHGLNNLIVLIMALYQIASGTGVYRIFVLGG